MDNAIATDHPRIVMGAEWNQVCMNGAYVKISCRAIIAPAIRHIHGFPRNTSGRTAGSGYLGSDRPLPERNAVVAKKRWNDLSPNAKAAVIAVAAVDAGLRAWALRDLAGRDASRINGPKWLWGSALGVLSTSGVVPVVYLVAGRKS